MIHPLEGPSLERWCHPYWCGNQYTRFPVCLDRSRYHLQRRSGPTNNQKVVAEKIRPIRRTVRPIACLIFAWASLCFSNRALRPRQNSPRFVCGCRQNEVASTANSSTLSCFASPIDIANEIRTATRGTTIAEVKDGDARGGGYVCESIV